MRLHHKQSGMSLIGMLCIAAMLGFFAMCIIKMAPKYFEYLSVKEIVSKVAEESDPTQRQTIGDIRRRIATLLNTNQVYDIKTGDVEIFRKEGKTYIDAGYEARVHLMWRIDALLVFDDLKYEVGSGQPVP